MCLHLPTSYYLPHPLPPSLTLSHHLLQSGIYPTGRSVTHCKKGNTRHNYLIIYLTLAKSTITMTSSPGHQCYIIFIYYITMTSSMPHQVYLLHNITLQCSQEVGGTASPVLYDELEGSAAVAVLEQSGDHKLEQHKLKLNLPNGAHGTGMCVWCVWSE